MNPIDFDFYNMYTAVAIQHAAILKDYEDVLDCHLSKKERQANIIPARNKAVNPKIGRNEPCPCNSGKKYKRCCFSNS